MRRLILKPCEFECSIEECPPGLFLHSGHYIGFKSEYAPNGKIEAFNEAGEAFCGDGKVIPLRPEWEEI